MFLSPIADILVLVGIVQVYTVDSAPLLGPVSNFDYQIDFRSLASYQSLKKQKVEHLLLIISSLN